MENGMCGDTGAAGSSDEYILKNKEPRKCHRVWLRG